MLEPSDLAYVFLFGIINVTIIDYIFRGEIMATGLLKRGKSYSARLGILTDFQATREPVEVVRSLITSDRKQAVIFLQGMLAGVDRLFFMVKSGMVDKGRLNIAQLR